jgi:hypothetical protein
MSAGPAAYYKIDVQGVHGTPNCVGDVAYLYERNSICACQLLHFRQHRNSAFGRKHHMLIESRQKAAFMHVRNYMQQK